MAGVPISPNAILAYPVGAADIQLESLVEGSRGWLLLRFSAASVLPADGVISLDLPASYSLNAGGNSSVAVSYVADDGGAVVRTTDAGYTTEILPLTALSALSAVEQALLTDTQRTNLAGQLLSTTVRARRVGGNSSESVAPNTLVSLNVSHVGVSASVGPSGAHNVSVLTADLAVIAQGEIPATQIGRPSAPRRVRLRNCQIDFPQPDTRCLQVEWEEPQDDAGSPVISYRVTLDSKSNAFDSRVQEIELNVQEAGTPLVVQSIPLAEGVTHYVKVEAANAKGGLKGYGRPAYGEPVRAISLPSPPRPAVLRSDTTNRLYLSWLPPQFTGALNPPPPVERYKIELDRNGDTFAAIDHNDTLVVAGDTRSVVSRLLRPGTYHARIYAANAAGYGPPAVFPVTALATPIMPVAWDEAVTPPALTLLPIQVGYELRQTVRAFDGDITDSLDIVVDADKGLPVNARLSSTALSGINGGLSNVATKVLTMTPDTAQAGMRFQVCLRARNVATNAPVLGLNIDNIRCFLIHVVQPVLSWSNYTDDVVSAGNQTRAVLTPAAGTVFTTFPGCQVDVAMYASAEWYKTVFGYHAYMQEFNGSWTRVDAMPGAQVRKSDSEWVCGTAGAPLGVCASVHTNVWTHIHTCTSAHTYT